MIYPVTGEHYGQGHSGMDFQRRDQDCARSRGPGAGAGGSMILRPGRRTNPPPAVNIGRRRSGSRKRCSTVEIRSGGEGQPSPRYRPPPVIEQGRNETAMVIGSEVISPAIAPSSQDRTEEDPEGERLPDLHVGGRSGCDRAPDEDSDQGLRRGHLRRSGAAQDRDPRHGGGTHAAGADDPAAIEEPGRPARRTWSEAGQFTP